MSYDSLDRFPLSDVFGITWVPETGTVTSVDIELPLTTPHDLVAQTQSDTEVELTWSDSSFRAVFSDVEFTFGAITTLDADAVSYSASFQPVNFDITRSLAAVSYSANFGTVNFDRTLAFESPLVTPVDLEATTQSDTEVELTWLDSSYRTEFADVDFSVTGGSGTNMDADAFSVSSSFQSVNFDLSRGIGSASYSSSFTDVDFYQTIPITGTTFSVAATFQSVGFEIVKAIAPVSYTTSFQNVGFDITRSLDSVAYTATFNDVTFTAAGVTTADLDSFSVSSSFQDITVDHTRGVGATSYSSTFDDVTFTKTRAANLDPFTVAATFNDVTFTSASETTVDLDPFSVSSSFQDITVDHTRGIGSVNYSATFSDVTFTTQAFAVEATPPFYLSVTDANHKVSIGSTTRRLNVSGAENKVTIDNDG